MSFTSRTFETPRSVRLLKSTIYPEPDPQQAFIPFVQERDKLGRLLSPNLPNVAPRLHKCATAGRLRRVRTQQRRYFLRKKQEISPPPIGFYDTNDNWIKTSYSSPKIRRNLYMNKILPKNPIQTESKTEAKTQKSQETGPANPHFRFKPSRQNMKFSTSKKDKLTQSIWDRVEIQETPQVIKEALRFNPQQSERKVASTEIRDTIKEFLIKYRNLLNTIVRS